MTDNLQELQDEAAAELFAVYVELTAEELGITPEYFIQEFI